MCVLLDVLWTARRVIRSQCAPLSDIDCRTIFFVFRLQETDNWKVAEMVAISVKRPLCVRVRLPVSPFVGSPCKMHGCPGAVHDDLVRLDAALSAVLVN